METKPNDLPLIVAHLLGGTNGFNFEKQMSYLEIQTVVGRAMAVAAEIQRQVIALSDTSWKEKEAQREGKGSAGVSQSKESF